jgi:hypothetical protein
MIDTATVNVAADHVKEVGEWSRKIIEVYMTWYTFFASSNVLAMGWIFGSEVPPDMKPMLRPICVLFAILNLLGVVSTGMVASATGFRIPEFEGLIHWAGWANGLALGGFAIVWTICFWKLRK